MTLQEALSEADKVQGTFGINVRGTSLGLIEDMAGETSLENIAEMWNDLGDDCIRDDKEGVSGHLSSKEIAILYESCKELIPVVLEECTTLKEVRETLR